MVDIHAHILPGLDDGSASMKMSLRMARQAVLGGTRHLVASSHWNLYPYRMRDYLERLEEFRNLLKENEIPLKVYEGQELMLNEQGIRLLARQEVLTLNKSRYLLVEYDFQEQPERMLELFGQVQELGYIPVIAHPERYAAVQRDLTLAEEFRNQGGVLQINGGSLLKIFGSRVNKTAEQLLENGVIGLIATDAHEDQYRTTDARALTEYLARHCRPSEAKLWLSENPSRILKDMPVLVEKKN